MDFKVVKHGYDQKQVDEYINKIVADYEDRLSKQKERIFALKDEVEKSREGKDSKLYAALLSSIERAKVIENSSKNIYELEAKRMVLIYNKMENLLCSENFASTSAKDNLLSFIKNCKKSLENSIEKQNSSIEEKADDPVKKLLAKMMGINNQKQTPSSLQNEDDEDDQGIEPLDTVPHTSSPSQKETSSQKTAKTTKEELKKAEKSSKNEEKTTSQDDEMEDFVMPDLPTIDKKSTDKNGFANFLSEDSGHATNFESIMFSKKNRPNFVYNKEDIVLDYTPNETGFDLKAAVNPTEDLDDIMKAFDFYNDNKKSSEAHSSGGTSNK